MCYSKSTTVLLLLLSRLSRVRLCATPQMAAHQAPRPWDFRGKNTGVGCHFLLQCMKVKSESEVIQSCLTLSDPMDCSPPDSSIHGIFQARVLEWGAAAFSSIYCWRRELCTLILGRVGCRVYALRGKQKNLRKARVKDHSSLGAFIRHQDKERQCPLARPELPPRSSFGFLLVY